MQQIIVKLGTPPEVPDVDWQVRGRMKRTKHENLDKRRLRPKDGSWGTP